jgi:hypothetical protein
MTLFAAAVALELPAVRGVVDGRRRRCGEPEAVGESAAQPLCMTAFLGTAFVTVTLPPVVAVFARMTVIRPAFAAVLPRTRLPSAGLALTAEAPTVGTATIETSAIEPPAIVTARPPVGAPVSAEPATGFPVAPPEIVTWATPLAVLPGSRSREPAVLPRAAPVGRSFAGALESAARTVARAAAKVVSAKSPAGVAATAAGAEITAWSAAGIIARAARVLPGPTPGATTGVVAETFAPVSRSPIATVVPRTTPKGFAVALPGSTP